MQLHFILSHVHCSSCVSPLSIIASPAWGKREQIMALPMPPRLSQAAQRRTHAAVTTPMTRRATRLQKFRVHLVVVRLDVPILRGAVGGRERLGSSLDSGTVWSGVRGREPGSTAHEDAKAPTRTPAEAAAGHADYFSGERRW